MRSPPGSPCEARCTLRPPRRSPDTREIAETIRDLSRSPRRDHRELFDRVVASIALGNTDDHLRNHGFLSDHGSWTLSPAFDVNPNPDLWRPRSTSIMGADTPPDEIDGVLALAEECDLTAEQARARMRAIAEAMVAWRERARGHGIREREVTMMAESIEPRLEAVAIDLPTLKRHQDRIRADLADIEHGLAGHDDHHAGGRAFLHDSLQLLTDAHRMYTCSDDSNRRLANQAFYARLEITKDEWLHPHLAEPFATLLDDTSPGDDIGPGNAEREHPHINRCRVFP